MSGTKNSAITVPPGFCNGEDGGGDRGSQASLSGAGCRSVWTEAVGGAGRVGEEAAGERAAGAEGLLAATWGLSGEAELLEAGAGFLDGGPGDDPAVGGAALSRSPSEDLAFAGGALAGGPCGAGLASGAGLTGGGPWDGGAAAAWDGGPREDPVRRDTGTRSA